MISNFLHEYIAVQLMGELDNIQIINHSIPFDYVGRKTFILIAAPDFP